MIKSFNGGFTSKNPPSSLHALSWLYFDEILFFVKIEITLPGANNSLTFLKLILKSGYIQIIETFNRYDNPGFFLPKK